MANTVKGVVSLLASLARVPRGLVAKGNRKQPEKPLVLYEAEYCPFCRYVRETLTELDLDVIITPIPKKGMRFKERLIALGGKPTVPFLIDPNNDTKLYESATIVEYLHKQYGKEGSEPRPFRPTTSLIATLLRGKSGMFSKAPESVNAPEQLLELYSFEASPFARLVRETLCELEIPYVLHNVGKAPGSFAEYLPAKSRAKGNYTPQTENRKKLAERGGMVMIPYLVDPNTGTSMYESYDIQSYLRATYGQPDSMLSEPCQNKAN